MGLDSHHIGHHHRDRRNPSFTTIVTATLFLLFSFLSAQLSSAVREEAETIKIKASGMKTMNPGLLTRRRLIGPGSSPPTCRSKCGRCSPCKPIHVPIQPGLTVPLEYYPEAWRCTCGTKLFMP